MFIWQPLAILLAVVEIQHGCHSVHTKSVYMEFLDPEQSICREEVGNLIAAIVEYISAPVRMLSSSWIRMLIEWHSIETSKSVCIPREMCRYPIEDNADSLAVHVINEIHKIYGITISAGRCVVIGNLVSP